MTPARRTPDHGDGQIGLPGLDVLSQSPTSPGAPTVLRGFALGSEEAILGALAQVTQQAPFRHMVTPGGYRMSVAMTNCGAVGWITDRAGYRYGPIDPDSSKPWPIMPVSFRDLAMRAAQAVGFSSFTPDACLINRYEPGAKLSLHQDKDEQDFSAPIVSVSLGLAATFLFGGLTRKEPAARIELSHGDVVVWGGAERLAYHGVAPLKAGSHAKLGNYRVNLTFRKAL